MEPDTDPLGAGGGAPGAAAVVLAVQLLDPVTHPW